MMRDAPPTLVGAGFAAAVVGTAVLAWYATSGPVQPLPGLGGAGDVTQWALPVSKALRDAAAAITIGLLTLAAVVLVPGSKVQRDRVEGSRLRAMLLAAAAASIWLAASIVHFVVTYSDLAGAAPATLTPSELFRFAIDFDLGRALLVSTLLVLAVAYGALLARSQTAVGILAVLAYAAIIPLALTGHSSTAANHALAVGSLVVHVAAVCAWVGGLAALAILWRDLGSNRRTTVRRFSRLAGVCFALVAASGVAGGVTRMQGVSDLASPYGRLIILKTGLLLTVAAIGLRQRRRVAQQTEDMTDFQWPVFHRLALIEIALLSVAVGLGVALSQTAPPGTATTLTTTEALLGYPMPEPLTPAAWFLGWRIDWTWASFSVLIAIGYLLAVRRLRRRGDAWPPGRTTAWIAGAALLLWATSGSPGAYGRVLFSMHMVQHMTIAMAVPVLLVLGAPVTLALRALHARTDGSRGPREWLLVVVHSRPIMLLGHPLVAPPLLIGSLVAFYTTGIFELAMSTHVGHVAMVTHFLIVGYLFASVICGIDPGPARLPYPFRLLLLIATMGFHAFFGVVMMGARTIYGNGWFSQLDRPWGPSLIADQERGGALAWAMGDYPVIILAIAMMVAWYRSDARDARRYDRQAERDGDAALARYNEQLRRLSTQTAVVEPPSSTETPR